ncbi:MAG TPA: class II fructose-bisphosphate aldolase [candidate division Zixibacteria bacterium]|nr:class II fructose-bisphosphate aldolase [candidate division Zixibacteria bacterium]
MSMVSADTLVARLNGIACIRGHRLEVTDPARFRTEVLDDLVFDAVFHPDSDLRDAARWIIWSASQALGCGSASIHELYMARGRGEFEPTRFTVPAINVRATAYLTARQVFAAALERDVGAVIFEIAKSEMAYTDQRPAEYTAVILAAAMREGWRGPVFLQGDHFQFNAKKWPEDPQAEMDGIKALSREAVEAGFLNIDIDSSTLVDLSQPTVPEQQRVNAANTAELTRFIRGLQPAGVTISIGGEIGEVGKANSTEEELRAYLDAYLARLEGSGLAGVSKVSIQTGTSHGGVPLPDGTIAQVKIDFDTLRRLSTVARQEYGLAGCVQHGASTLPDDAFHHFPANGTAEVHLATGFQNILYDRGGLPDELRAEMMEWCRANCADERKAGETEEQFLYKTRKKALGPFKRQLWTLPEEGRQRIGANLRAQFGLLFDELGVRGTRELVDRYVTPPDLPRPRPAALGGDAVEAITADASVFADDPSGE